MVQKKDMQKSDLGQYKLPTLEERKIKVLNVIKVQDGLSRNIGFDSTEPRRKLQMHLLLINNKDQKTTIPLNSKNLTTNINIKADQRSLNDSGNVDVKYMINMSLKIQFYSTQVIWMI